MTRATLRVRVPGEPCAQGRGQASFIPGVGIRVRDPRKSREWKTWARGAYELAIAELGIVAPAFDRDVPLDLYVVAIFACPRSDWRATPRPRRRKTSKPDGSNVLKIVEDAGNGVLWHDDSQLVRVTCERWIGAQNEEPGVYLTITALV